MSYDQIFSRNIGIVSLEQQNKIKQASILICGAGGMGGVCAEVLTRMGVGKLRIIDPDIFEKSNLNRQIASNINTIGTSKVLALKKHLQLINPDIEIDDYFEPVNLGNVECLLKDIDIVINAMDQFLPSIILERLAHTKGIPIIDAWLTPFANVFVIKKDDPHWEDYLNLVTKDKSIQDITEEDLKNNLKIELSYTLSFFDPFKHITKELVNQVVNKTIARPSFSVVVFLCGTLMANEAFKLILGLETTDFKGFFFNQYDNLVMKA